MSILTPQVPAFKASKLTATTFLIVEHSDVYDEHPYIYVKVLDASTLLILDTGCGGKADDPDINLTSLRKFVETVGVAENAGKPLNEGQRRGYIVILSHCHYDHILGVEQFTEDSQILVSGFAPEFNSPSNLPQNSLCESLGIEVPQYSPIFVEDRYTIRTTNGNVYVLHTPGHTPDELALWDEDERMLYVGDTLYEWAPIIFPVAGSIVAWLQTVDALLQLVAPFADARISCGHVTAGEPATEVLLEAKSFMGQVLQGKIKPTRVFEKGGEEHVHYKHGARYDSNLTGSNALAIVLG
ncbi:hypothetical protein EUX98_g4175 [Antrodiella citrinella]|uniref:Metallo-beta-lactamase domain-containing protein n=1 Tax=Antrodiella citrinella TaxID=2447956 RepID=A0A4V3XIQ1_9APHY|nr:hypothetical protein EUX98_g4175 [Antrodiella citrinella]